MVEKEIVCEVHFARNIDIVVKKYIFNVILVVEYIFIANFIF